MKFNFSLSLLFLTIIVSGCNSADFERFNPLFDLYPNIKGYDAYLIFPPSCCYFCQNGMWKDSHTYLINNYHVYCIYSTESYDYNKLSEKCYYSGITGYDYTIDTVLFDHIDLLPEELGYPLLISIKNKRIADVIVCKNSIILHSEMKKKCRN